MPKISIIVPVYNAERYLNECISSILNQTFSDFELLLIDDGSTDKSGIICDYYGEKDERIRVIHKKNEGVSIARNAALEIVRGEYITFVDADDTVDKGFLEAAVDIMTNTQADIFISGLQMETWKNGEVRTSVQYGIIEAQIYTIRELLENVEVTYSQICICGVWCKLYKRKIIQEHNIRFTALLDHGEDTYFNLDYFLYSKRVAFSEKIFYHYRHVNQESLFRRFHKDTYEVLQMVYSKMRTLMQICDCCQNAMERFEVLYFGMLLGCIHEYYRFYRMTTLRERLGLIVRAAEDSCVSEVQIRRIKNWKSRILLVLLRLKWYRSVAFIFGAVYRRRDNQ